jgi:hypothetical protein
MIVGGEKISETAERVLSKIDRDDVADLIEVDQVMVIVAVNFGGDEAEESETGALYYRCTSARGYVQRGLLTYAAEAVRFNRQVEG